MLDFDMMPPDWEFAKQHAKASKPGVVHDIQSQKTQNVYCPCCLKPVIKSEISLWSNSKQLEFLGFGFPLYFIFLKYCIVLILVLIVTYSGIALYWGIQSNSVFCSHRRLSSSEGDLHCTSFMVMFSRIQLTLTGEQIIIRITCFIAHLLALIYIRDAVKKTYEYYDEKTTSLSDYSIIIDNLPLKSGIQENIKNFVHDYFQPSWQEIKQVYNEPWIQQETKVMQITLLPDINDYYELIGSKQKLIQEKRKQLIKLDKQLNSKIKNTKKIQALQQAIQQVNQQIYKLNLQINLKCQKYKLLASEDQLHSHKAIIVLNSQIFKNIVVEESTSLTTETVGKYFGQFQGKIKVSEAPQPNEIIWAHANFSQSQRFFAKITGWALSILFIAVITVGFYFLVVLKTKNLINAIEHNSNVQQLHADPHYKIAVLIVYLFLFLIVLFNKLILGPVLHYFTFLEKHQTTANQQFSFAIKYTIGMFFTTALMTLAVEDITFHNFYSHEYGVIQEEFVMFFINAFLVPLIWLINPEQIQVLIQRKLSQGKNYFTQHEANRIMSDSSYKMGKRYAQVVKTMWFTFLYATLIPSGPFITLVGFCIYYWIDKYNLLRRSSVKGNISGKMAMVSIKLLDFSLFLMPIGSLLFDSQIRSQIHPSTIVLASIGFVYLFVPIDALLLCLHEEKFKQQEKPYSSVKDHFLQTYQTLNPILSFKIRKVFEKLQRRVGRKISLGVLDNTLHKLRSGKSITSNQALNIQISDEFVVKTTRRMQDPEELNTNRQGNMDSNTTQIDMLQKNN